MDPYHVYPTITTKLDIEQADKVLQPAKFNTKLWQNPLDFSPKTSLKFKYSPTKCWED